MASFLNEIANVILYERSHYKLVFQIPLEDSHFSKSLVALKNPRESVLITMSPVRVRPGERR